MVRYGELSPSSVGMTSEGDSEAPDVDVTEEGTTRRHSEADIEEAVKEEEEEEKEKESSSPFGCLFDSLVQSLSKVLCCPEYLNQRPCLCLSLTLS